MRHVQDTHLVQYVIVGQSHNANRSRLEGLGVKCMHRDFVENLSKEGGIGSDSVPSISNDDVTIFLQQFLISL
jgi:hypothetical protein